MDDPTKAELDGIAAEADALVDEIEAAFDEHAEFSFRLATREKLEECGRRYREACARLDEKDRLAVDRTVGRKIQDVYRAGSHLPQLAQGRPAEQRPQVEFWEARPQSADSSRQPRVMGAESGRVAKDRSRYRVTGDVEAWCSPCTNMTTHTIVAIVGGLPAQVVCQACGGRHKYRGERPDKKRRPSSSTGAVPHRPSAAEVEAQKRARERRALIEELEAATAVRAFSRLERYRAGEIISHPEHGRGKVESVLARSMLVRFATGLKPVKLV